MPKYCAQDIAIHIAARALIAGPALPPSRKKRRMIWRRLLSSITVSKMRLMRDAALLVIINAVSFLSTERKAELLSRWAYYFGRFRAARRAHCRDARS